MIRRSRRTVPIKTRPVNAVVAKNIKRFSEGRRNIVRGAVASALHGSLGGDKVEVLRNNQTEGDMVAAALILESPGGLRERKITSLVQEDLTPVHRSKSKSSVLEAAYACSFLNGWKDDSVRAINTIALLSQIVSVPVQDALSALLTAVQMFGASSYISNKVAYAKEFFDLDDGAQSTLAQIDDTLGHKKSPNIQFHSLEVLKDNISIFTVARRHSSIFQKVAQSDFRKALSLNGLVATPMSEADCAGFFLRAVESSLVDAVHAIWVVLTLRQRFPTVVASIERHLDPDLRAMFDQALCGVADVDAPNLVAELIAIYDDDSRINDNQKHISLSLYRRCSAFLEFPSLASFRNDIDQVIGPRLMAPLLPEITRWQAPDFSNKQTLRRAETAFDLSLHGQAGVKIDTFYRTYLFLRFIQDPQNLALLDSDDVQYIFDSTMGLESLILERELKTIHLNASDDAQAILSVLAMALYKAKSSDPDVDFDFRAKLEEYIVANFKGKISAFIDHIAPKSPDVASYIVSSLDEATLQKMYTIIGSLSQAEEARRDILTTVGIHLNKIEYIVEAEAIETRAKVAKLKDYFDTSRMFVDSIAMRDWLASNPSACAQQYKEMLPKLAARLLAASKKYVTPSGEEKRFELYHITSTDEYLVSEMVKEAFREFCVNNEFGIESYLGRRIRHNTLQGVMTKSTDAVLQRPEHQAIIVGTPFGRALGLWESWYGNYIERMRKEFLQFKAENKPNALFNSAIDLTEPVTKRNLQQLIKTLRMSGTEMLDELIVSFCWRQVAPQLEAASRQIRVKMAQEVTQNLDQLLGRFDSPEERKIKAALSDAVSSVFAQVASWFQVPETGFVPASIVEICNIIDIEHGRPASTTVVEGNNLAIKYFGISVHRLYDCLAVLLQNAFKHAESGSDVTVHVSSKPLEGADLHVLEIGVRSSLPMKKSEECISRVEAAVTSTETGKDMVTEGYSGIKKVKFITRLNEGASTVRYEVADTVIEVGFTLKAEVADGEDGLENPPH